MKSPQVINLEEDAVLVIDGLTVMYDVDQTIITDQSSIRVDIILFDIKAGLPVDEIIDAGMVYDINAKFWTINIKAAGGSQELYDILIDRRKYVGLIKETAYGGSIGMREFKLQEFATDAEVVERGAFEIKIGTPSYIYWPEETGWKYRAEAYEGGTGTTDATSVEKITHRGEIEQAS